MFLNLNVMIILMNLFKKKKTKIQKIHQKTIMMTLMMNRSIESNVGFDDGVSDFFTTWTNNDVKVGPTGNLEMKLITRICFWQIIMLTQIMILSISKIYLNTNNYINRNSIKKETMVRMWKGKGILPYK